MKNKGFYNNENKEWAEKVKSFFKESGFYVLVVVGLCILAVGAVYFTTNHLISSPEDDDGLISEGGLSTDEGQRDIVFLEDQEKDDMAIEGSDIYGKPIDLVGENDSSSDSYDTNMGGDGDTSDLAEPDIETINKPTASPTKAPVPTRAPEQTNPPKSTDPSDKTDTPDKTGNKEGDSQEVIKLFGKAPEFIMPVEGKIIMDYAMDRLLYSKTLDEWRIHTGIDIAAPRGNAVKAVGDGYVKEIKEDPCYGTTITIDHENGYKTIYSNLAGDSMVSVNQKVKAGDAISSVGNTAIFECMDPPHLHFEAYKNDKLVDPKTVLPKAQE